MLTIHTHAKQKRLTSIITTIIGLLILVVGLYILSITLAPAAIPLIPSHKIDTATLPKPQKTDNRIIIPAIGVNIHYAPGAAALDAGAQWRQPSHGNPANGGNFVIAAHRLSIQPTPWATIEKSPFYNIDKLAVNDAILVDYIGKRYTYIIKRIFNVTPDQVEIENISDHPQLTLYSCDLTGAATGRIVIIAEPKGSPARTSQFTQ